MMNCRDDCIHYKICLWTQDSPQNCAYFADQEQFRQARKGNWIIRRIDGKNNSYEAECPFCGRIYISGDICFLKRASFNYCPDCGALLIERK